MNSVQLFAFRNHFQSRNTIQSKLLPVVVLRNIQYHISYNLASAAFSTQLLDCKPNTCSTRNNKNPEMNMVLAVPNSMTMWRATIILVASSSICQRRFISSNHGSVGVVEAWTTRGGTQQEEEDGVILVSDNLITNKFTSVADAMIDTQTGKVLRFSEHAMPIQRTNDVVEQFFETTLTEYNNNDETGSSAALLSSILSSSSSNALSTEIESTATNMTEFLKATRRLLHRHPELMYEEEFTSKTVQTLLREWNVSYTSGWAINTNRNAFPGPGGYGIVADIGTGMEPCILLRADMDALPIMERTTNIDEYKSQIDNKMHACGHDAHTTMLLGAVSILKSIESSIPGTIRIMFQPAEEGGAGCKRMLEEGVLTKHPKPSYAFGMHVWPTIPTGTIAARAGPLMAACERFEVLVAGVGGHAAMPHLTIDPIVAVSAIVMNLQTIVSRTISPLEAGVCSITQIDTGSGAFNVIPHSATLRGTIRSLSTETLLQLRDRVQHIIEMTAAVHGCNVTITYSPDYYPVTVNDPTLYETFSKHVGGLLSTEGLVRDIEPTMGAEDFSFIAETIPSTFFFLGQGSGTNPPTSYGLHHPHFALDERVLPTGVALHVNLALRSIAKLRLQAINNGGTNATRNYGSS